MISIAIRAFQFRSLRALIGKAVELSHLRHVPAVFPDEGAADDEPARQLAEELLLALEDVRGEYREAFLLFHQQQMGYQGIAERMQRPVGTVKTWVHRARREIIQRLTERGVLAEVRYELPVV